VLRILSSVVLLGFTFAQDRLLDPKSIPDELAYTAIFFVVRTAPPPHWNYETRLKWLTDRGLDGPAGQKVIRIADRYFAIHETVEAELAAFNAQRRNSLTPEAQDERARIEAKRTVAMREAIQSLRTELVTSAALENVNQLITGVKSDMKVRAR
jgi:hypothetical protein